jgi:hypothetical protein
LNSSELYISESHSHLGERHVPFVLNVNLVMSGMAMLRTASQSMLKSKKSHLRPPSSLSAVSMVRPSLDVSARVLEDVCVEDGMVATAV